MNSEVYHKLEPIVIASIRLYEHVHVTSANSLLFKQFINSAFQLIRVDEKEDVLKIIRDLKRASQVLMKTNYFDSALQQEFEVHCTVVENELLNL